MTSQPSPSPVGGVIRDVKRLRDSIAGVGTPQLWSAEARAHIKAVAFSWFQNYKPSITKIWAAASVDDIDATFRQLLMVAEKAPSTAKVQALLKAVQGRLVSLQSALAGMAPSVADTPPAFGGVPDPAMRQVLTRRWNECVACLAADAPLAATVMMGGLLESLFLGRVIREPNKKSVFTARAAPKDSKTQQPLSLDRWTLQDYIAVAYELGWIRTPVRDVSHIVRDYRNYIHPHKELSNQLALTVDDARMFWQVSKAIVGFLL
jgi:hypothetical protein